MRLSLKNIGKIGEAEIVIDGITVIAGENDTGKSTIGRALYAVFNSFCNYEAKIRYNRRKSVENLLDGIYDDDYPETTVDTGDMAEEIVDRIEEFRNMTEDSLLALMAEHDADFDWEDEDLVEATEAVVPDIQRILNVPAREALCSVLDRNIDVEFSSQFKNIYREEPGEVRLTIKDKTIRVAHDGKQVTEVEEPISLRTEVAYIDDPFVIDETRRPYYRYGGISLDHREHLRRKLARQQEINVIDEIVTGQRFEDIYSKISSVCDGEIVMSKRYDLGYRPDGRGKALDVHNLSTGLKTFMILKLLLMNGTLERKGTIVLDEPEIHLHPEWQLLFAELIVLLQKEFDMHILLNTHSPYFLRAIQVFSARHGTADVCRYYLSEAEGDIARLEDVTDEIDRIYRKLSEPFQQLEDVRWQDV